MFGWFLQPGQLYRLQLSGSGAKVLDGGGRDQKTGEGNTQQQKLKRQRHARSSGVLTEAPATVTAVARPAAGAVAASDPPIHQYTDPGREGQAKRGKKNKNAKKRRKKKLVVVHVVGCS